MLRSALYISGLIAAFGVLAMSLTACGDSGAQSEGAAKAHQKRTVKYPCGGSGLAVANQTCRFAANVKADYYSKIGSGSGSVFSYSPIDGQSYMMHCTADSPHVCTGGNNATVYFR
jgi:hypothetical protein